MRLSAIGDVCNAQATALALARAWPDTHLTWVVGRTEAALVADTPGIEFITFDKRLGFGAVRRLRRDLAGRRFDILLNMHASMRANVASCFIRARRRLGFDRARARDFQWLVTNEQIAPLRQPHVVDGFLQFAAHLGIDVGDPAWAIPVPDDAREFAQTIAHNAGRVLLLSPCSSQRANNFRNWSAENYARVVRHAAERWSARTILTGGPTPLETDYAARIAELAGDCTDNLVGRTSLKQLYALIEAADLVLCPDSGPVHMANAARTPVIGLYATSNPNRTGPYRYRELVVNAYPQAVAGEFSRDVDELRWGQRVRNPDAMSLIGVDAVTARIDQVLGA